MYTYIYRNMLWKIRGLSRRALKPYFAEFLGTALLIVIGDGVVAQCLLSNYQYGTWLSINIAWAAAVCISGYLSDPSPTINPAITICMALVRPVPEQWRKLPGKLVAQFLGGFVGAAIVYINYRSAIKAWDPEFTIPELLASAVLMFGSLCISDPANGLRFQSSQLSVFLLLLAIGTALGWQTGYAINPARDFGPRLFSAIIYGREVFTAKNYYFVVPIFAPIFGCIMGATVYDSTLYEGDGSRVTNAVTKLEEEDGSLRLD
ncbi:uncharacterized protein ATNIH1004_006469 [Aspergillus tanneri]|uniref:Aquaporin n=1 Tax=Aspergillus tanneri TaxID=1220188 RepID=A0A5M9ML78_9EURO|nr:uncharacterized protein ATNIH1004_006469 [Aspergillus tanneri]KAA8647768.1 hypothetical protein ATNIH1004_006469 [Aspergillus tanneri]